MRKVILTAWVLVIIISIATLSSLGGTYHEHNNEVVNGITGLESLTVELPEPIGTISAEPLVITWSGRETEIINSNQYLYNAHLDSAILEGFTTIHGDKITIKIESGMINEHFKMENPVDDPADVVVPDDVDILFKAKLAVLYIGDEQIYLATLEDVILKIKGGEVQLLKFKTLGT